MTAGKKIPPKPPTPVSSGRQKKNADFAAQRVEAQFGKTGSSKTPSIPGGQFGTDSKPRSVFNKIAESGMNFVRNVMENSTRADMPVLDLKNTDNDQFKNNEPSEVHEYAPTWEGQQPQSPQFGGGGGQQQENFTKFQSAIRQWNAKEANAAFAKPKQQRKNVVFMPQKRRSGWRWIIVLIIIGGIGIGGLYTYRFVNDKLISDFKAKVKQKEHEADFDDGDIVEEDKPKRVKRRYNKKKRRRRP